RPAMPTNILALLRIPESKRTAKQSEELAIYALDAEVDRELGKLPPARMVYAAARDFTPSGSFKPSLKPRPVHLLRRGDINKPEGLVGPGTLQSIPGLTCDLSVSESED